MDYPPLRVVRFSGAALTEGIEEHIIDGVPVRVTNIARTVADFLGFGSAELPDIESVFREICTIESQARPFRRMSSIPLC